MKRSLRRRYATALLTHSCSNCHRSCGGEAGARCGRGIRVRWGSGGEERWPSEPKRTLYTFRPTRRPTNPADVCPLLCRPAPCVLQPHAAREHQRLPNSPPTHFHKTGKAMQALGTCVKLYNSRPAIYHHAYS